MQEKGNIPDLARFLDDFHFLPIIAPGIAKFK
jgi:hypothetical protein